MGIVINEQLTRRLMHKCLKDKCNDSPLPCEFVQNEYTSGGSEITEFGLECVLCGYEVMPDEIAIAYEDILLDQNDM